MASWNGASSPLATVGCGFRIGALWLCIFFLGACASSPTDVPNPDPLEPLNRATYRFNEEADQWVLRPVAKAYDQIAPEPVKIGISNFFDNLGEPVVAVNNLAQGKPVSAASDVGRFAINTTVGILGVIDVATLMGLGRNREDFGQTLGYWGMGPGWYLVLPLLGSSTVRDGFGILVDWQVDPISLLPSTTETTVVLLAVDAVSVRASLLPADRILEVVYDPYAFTRDAYLQRRRVLVSDGTIEDDELLDPDTGITPPWEQ
ncbi:MAG: VacJ family lipoprotein [Pseudomonadota bacterium]|nr:VacJ family lipoprotein [Pseudomonadota bacterium]